MPRPRKPGAPEPKRRSRTGCWPCKSRKVKCGEEKPSCVNCLRQGETCDYSIRLNWDGRTKKPAQSAALSPAASASPRDASFVVAPDNTTGNNVGVAHQADGPVYRVGAFAVRDEEADRKSSNPAPKRIKLSSELEHVDINPMDDRRRPTTSLISPYPDTNHGGQAWLSSGISPSHAESTIDTEELQGTGSHCTSLDRDVQRVSVQSLLSPPITARPLLVKSPESGYSDTVRYGYDCGRWDLDLNRNDDLAAIQRDIGADSPTSTTASVTADVNPKDQRKARTAFGKGGYYAQPVPISISRHLSPLPPALHENPIHLLYFHHFMNHTAKILVPHACASNPFEHVLPAMAIQDENLLNMLFAYSASHRARLLGHAEPSSRIAHWTCNVFTNLRESLEHAEPRISDTSLAAAIMLASLKIISPTTFEAPITWQSHLKLARELFITRNNVQRMSAADKVGSFLGRWLGYLDIMGSLSSRDIGAPLFGGNYWSMDSASTSPGQRLLGEGEVDIDCFTGFTPQCRQLLARLAGLMHECDVQRFNSVSRIDPRSDLPSSLRRQADQLLGDFKIMGSPDIVAYRRHHGRDDSDMGAVDDAYRLAGVVQLYRRVLGPQASWEFEVQDAVGALIAALDRIPRGGSAEVCCLFPFFTAGCETDDPIRRQDIRNRVKSFEGVGLKQIRSARKLMERTWEEDLSWTDLANGEFLG